MAIRFSRNFNPEKDAVFVDINTNTCCFSHTKNRIFINLRLLLDVLGHKFRFSRSFFSFFHPRVKMINLCAFLVAVVVEKRHLILFMKIRRIAMSKENLLFLVKKFSSDINSHFSFKWLYVRCCYQLDLRTCLQVDMLEMQMEIEMFAENI